MTTATKTPKDSIVQTRKIVSNEHLNPNGVLFGGYLMCWIDEIAFMSARRYAGSPSCVTVNIDNISFMEPIQLGEEVQLTACVNYVGNTSMEIGVKVEKEGSSHTDLKHTNSAYLTFVCLDKNFRPTQVPSLRLETEEDQRRYQEAYLRLKVRKRLKTHFENKLKTSNVQKIRPAASLATIAKRRSAMLLKHIEKLRAKNNFSKMTERFYFF
jgi:acyl-CoA hydrolase